jgi:transcriptional regulator with XRE-family HTH domain
MQTFGETLNRRRKELGLTVEELAKAAGVYESLISSLNNDKRVIGEISARKIGRALQLTGDDLEDFVYQAINNCSERVLSGFKQYPAEVLNATATVLALSGISPDSIRRCVRKATAADPDVTIYLNDGKSASINVEVAYE